METVCRLDLRVLGVLAFGTFDGAGPHRYGPANVGDRASDIYSRMTFMLEAAGNAA